MHQRSLHRAVRLVLVLVGQFLTTAVIADDEPAGRPNIIYVMADDLGYGDLGCYGQQRIRTPNIDRMADEGVRFTDYYAGSTVCAPSRCVLMTGYHTGHCYIRGNGKHNLRAGHVTVAEVLKFAGYRTGGFGKWGLGQPGSGGAPHVQGFELFYGYLDQTHAHNYYPTHLYRNRDRVELNNVVPNEGAYGQGVATEKNEYSHDLIWAEAMQFIDEHHDEPMFIYLPVTIPHANNQAGREGMEVPDYGPYADEDWPEPQKGLAAMITRLDTDMGLLFTKLREHGIDENTIVFFTSDNGPHREGGNDPDFFDSNGPLRGIKRALYEGGIRVPMIVRWPGHIEPGSVSNHIGYHGDLTATVSELTSTGHVPGIDSVSMLPAILGNDGAQAEHHHLYWEFYERGFKQAVRRGDWKAIRRFRNDEVTAELYNLADDLSEEHDLADEHADVLAELLAVMDHAHVPSPLWPTPEAVTGE
jgi:arylsulfatase A-like enzyme